MSEEKQPSAMTQLPPRKEAPPARLIFTLGMAGFLSGVVLVGMYLFTLPVIEANKKAAMERAIFQVLPDCSRYEAMMLESGELASAQEGAEQKMPLTYAGYNQKDELIGFAITAEEPGYQDVIVGIFGYNPQNEQIVGLEILESKETPGLGDKIFKDDDFRANFKSLSASPLPAAVKKGEKAQSHEVEAISGATISSKAVVRLIGNGLTEWKEAMDAYYGRTVNSER
jgi:electron transport complex protein RnfG